MTPVDTAALRALADAGARSLAFTDPPTVRLDVVTLRALCDGYDRAQRLRAVGPGRHEVDVNAWRQKHLAVVAERDAARQALADLVADLKAVCGEARVTISAGCACPGDGECGCSGRPLGWSLDPAAVRAVIDRHAPAAATTEDR